MYISVFTGTTAETYRICFVMSPQGVFTDVPSTVLTERKIAALFSSTTGNSSRRLYHITLVMLIIWASR